MIAHAGYDSQAYYGRVYVTTTDGTAVIYTGFVTYTEHPRYIAPGLTPEQLFALVEQAAEEKRAPARDKEPRPAWPTPHDEKSPRGPIAGQCRPCPMLARPPPVRLELATARTRGVFAPCSFYRQRQEPSQCRRQVITF